MVRLVFIAYFRHYCAHKNIKIFIKHLDIEKEYLYVDSILEYKWLLEGIQGMIFMFNFILK